MPKYLYKLTVRCNAERFYGPGELRRAVAYLKTIDGTDDPALHIGLLAESNVRAGKWKLHARAFLRLDQIAGKTPREVWQMFDDDVDGQIEGLLRRQQGFVRTAVSNR